MLTKTTIALTTALLLGVVSAAQAGGSRDEDTHTGGFRVGPLGQSFNSGVNPVDHPSLAAGAYGLAQPRHPAPRPRHPRAVR
jgi:hypothetical protein